MIVYKDTIKSLAEAIEYEKGHIKARGRTVMVQPLESFESNEIRSLQLNLALSQVAFAAVMGVSAKTVEAWESGRNEPSGPARRLLELIANDKQVVKQLVETSSLDY